MRGSVGTGQVVFNTMLTQFWLHLIVTLVLPACFIYSLWRGRERSKSEWLVKALYTGAFVLYLFLVGNWAWLSYYLRYLILVVYLVAAAISYQKIAGLPLSGPGQHWDWRRTGSLLSLAIFAAMLAFAVRGHFYSREPVRLTFPLRDSRYLIWQGGNSGLLNYHITSRSQRYALDVLAINAAGRRALGIYPSAPGRYVIFGTTVYSPCDGTVLAVVDGLPDHMPPATDRQQPAGNHVVIGCSGAEVVLAHLQNGSLIVQAGDKVITGRRLGRVGNSANTSEPHLHIHAVSAGSGGVPAGEGIPMLFEGKFLVRNTVIRS
jgi:Peptidase family M23